MGHSVACLRTRATLVHLSNTQTAADKTYFASHHVTWHFIWFFALQEKKDDSEKEKTPENNKASSNGNGAAKEESEDEDLDIDDI